jgi:hypothetical protein
MQLHRLRLMTAVVATGGGVAIAIRRLLPSGSGFTITTPTVTHYVGSNVVCFWGVIVLTVGLMRQWGVRGARAIVSG